MEILTIKEELLSLSKDDNSLQQVKIFDSVGLQIYPKSIREYDDIIFSLFLMNE